MSYKTSFWVVGDLIHAWFLRQQLGFHGYEYGGAFQESWIFEDHLKFKDYIFYKETNAPLNRSLAN